MLKNIIKRKLKLVVIVLFLSFLFSIPISFNKADNNSINSNNTAISINTANAGWYDCVINGNNPLCGITGPIMKLWENIPTPGHVTTWMVDATIGSAASLISLILLAISALLLSFAGNLFDTSMGIALQTPVLTDMVKIGWPIVRDLANMFFIFILLYIAIATILQLNSFDTKKILSKLIVVALLINFSLFFTYIVIDASNIMALNFYNAITHDGKQLPSTGFMRGFDVTTLYKVAKGADEKKSNVTSANMLELAKVAIIGSGFMLVVTFVFLAGAIMFIIRFISLTFVAILAPLGFLAMILPGTSGYAKKWWDALINQSILAPVFLFFLYLVGKMISELNNIAVNKGSISTLIADANIGAPGNSSILLRFVVLTGLMIASLVVAKSISSGIATTSISWASKASGAVGGFAGRHTAGRAFNKFVNSDTGRKIADSGFAGRHFMNLTKKYGAEGSFDIRGAGIPGVSGSAGGAGGFAAARKADKDLETQAMVDKHNSMSEDDQRDHYAKMDSPKRKKLAEKLTAHQIAKLDPEGKHIVDVEDVNKRAMVDKAMSSLKVDKITEKINAFKAADKTVDIDKAKAKLDGDKGDLDKREKAKDDREKSLTEAFDTLSKDIEGLKPSELASIGVPAALIEKGGKDFVEKMSMPQFNKVVNGDNTGKAELDAFKEVVSKLENKSQIKQAAIAGGSAPMKYISGAPVSKVK